MFDYDKFRVNLILKRKILKVTQEDIAQEMDLSEKNLSKVEKANQEPKLQTVLAILNFFNCTLEQFMNDNNEQEKDVIINKIINYASELTPDEKQIFYETIQEYRKELQ